MEQKKKKKKKLFVHRFLNWKLIEEIKNCGIAPSDSTANENFCLYESNVNEIHGLIGADDAGKLFTGEIKNLPSGLVAMNTYFGWTVMGRAGEEWVSEKIIEAVEPEELAREKGQFYRIDPSLKKTPPLESARYSMRLPKREIRGH
ncbi:uncharacterized protein TNCV_1399001 [Trichonephila clavipes]|nr:uncharacterized protein TNCV_1399001 [Trichonephila clavipes]